jgi:hypothetical protein
MLLQAEAQQLAQCMQADTQEHMMRKLLELSIQNRALIQQPLIVTTCLGIGAQGQSHRER